MDNNKKFYCSFEIITPVHIGSGEDYYLTDYYFDDQDNKLIFYDKTKVSQLICKQSKKEFADFLKAAEAGDYFKLKRAMKPHIKSAASEYIDINRLCNRNHFSQ
ncbi:MAG: hypothetical protein JRJ44_05745 [Deltaproteobacteria bacterium]|nr:hypothetical protein [Deltaproteobacteria bacterium]